MHTGEYSWDSPGLKRKMSIRVYGHWGQPYLVFPCSNGRYFDYETMGMVDAIAPFINGGNLKLFCVDSLDDYTWYDFGISPAERDSRYEQYNRYIRDEVVPFIRDHCHDSQQRVMTSGCSMGAYHAVNFFLKYPDIFAGTIALSGLYRLDREEFSITGNEVESVYYNSPIHYLAGLDNPWFLELYRQSSIIICTGQGAWEDESIADTRKLGNIFKAKSVDAWIDFWGHDVNHDWPWWYKQMNYFLGKLAGR